MRQYAFLLVVVYAIAARAASIPDQTAPQHSPQNNLVDEQKVNVVYDGDEKVLVNDADMRDLINKDENESQNIFRQAIDLNNPGPPQRQEHETQNPVFYASEQQIVKAYKQNINEAQEMLKERLKGVYDDIQQLFDNHEQVKSVQQRIRSLQNDFQTQIDKLNGTLQAFLKPNVSDSESRVKQLAKDGLRQAEDGLTALKNEFVAGVNVLADGVLAFSHLRTNYEIGKQEQQSNGTAPPNNGPGFILGSIVNRIQTNVQDAFKNVSQIVTNFINPQYQGITPVSGAAVQNDAPETSTSGSIGLPNLPPWLNFSQLFNQNQNGQQQDGAGSTGGPFVQIIQNLQSQFTNLFTGTTQSPQPAQTAQAAKPDSSSPSESTEQKTEQPQSVKPADDKNSVQASTAAPLGPIRQMLQNNPITQSINNAVHRLQNVNNPDKPRNPEEAGEQVKGHKPAQSDNNNVNGVKENETEADVTVETVPEVPQDENKQQTEQVDNKTE